MTKLDGKTPDLAAENIEQLRQIFPDVFEEGKIDFDKLKQVLGEYVDDEKERYNFTWNGKGKALRLAQTPTTGTLRPCPKEGESKNWDDTQNLYIEGDNLEVLKLLQKSYHGKIKMIYIDPPYNTGGDFIYPDDFTDGIENYKRITGQVDGNGRPLSPNTEANGRYHTDWLNMMYPRLRLARNLLTENGVIFVSIDDNESTNLKNILDEIFGADNYVNIISLNLKNSAGASGGGEDKRLKKNCEYILIYAKNYPTLSLFKGPYQYTEMSNLIQSYIEEGKSWKYTSVLLNPGVKTFVGSTVDGEGNEIKVYRRDGYETASINQLAKQDGITQQEAYKKYGVNIFRTTNAQTSIRTRIIEFRKKHCVDAPLLSIEYIPKTGKNKGIVYEQFYKDDECNLFVWLRDTSEIIDGELYKKDLQGTLWDFVGETKNLTKEGDVQFPNGKKPVKLIKQMVSMTTEDNDIILDFFSGSATTAHAVVQLNSEDNGNRKFILVQLPINCADELHDESDDFSTICEIGKERIRRAGEKIKAEVEEQNAQLKIGEESRKVPDIGFKVFKLDSSNLKQWQPDYDDLEATLFDSISNYVEGRSELDVVYEIMLKMGMELTWPLETHTIGGKNVYEIGMGALMICLDDQITTEVAEGMATLYKELAPETWRVVFKDNGFADDSAKVNIKEILKTAGLEEDAFTTV